ncbi:hypothetical protein QLL71_004994 [Salmonella enterica]|uniref:Uncharacterized protein n=1 Tax=Salmonella enterica TaxID=28901 RepID=A0A742ZKU2_SALER|nr:hypothetical protein [Salmonella enterica]HAF1616105.1 hypothetical protein [Salmonella enterica]
MENHKATAGRPEPGECGAGKATSFCLFCLSSPASSQSPAEKLKKEKGFDSPSLSRYRLQLIVHRTQLI